jgi:hypothetical protein
MCKYYPKLPTFLKGILIALGVAFGISGILWATITFGKMLFCGS